MFCALSWLTAACGDTGQELVSLDVMGRGVATTEIVVVDWEVTLEVAEVAFGPAYFCATDSADIEHCPTAVAEMREAVTIDALDPDPHMLGQLDALTGNVRSAMYDYGITWLLTQSAPSRLDAAPDGHAAYFRGRATRAASSFRFEAWVDVVPRTAGNFVIRGARTRHELTADSTTLTVHIDPYAWWQRLDFDALADLAAAEGLLNDETGRTLRIETGSSFHDDLVTAMTAGRLPTLTWR